MKNFRISGLPAGMFRNMVSSSDTALAAAGMRRIVADAKPGYPCRVSLEDAEVGETVILVHYRHHAVAGPYGASGPIFVREAASSAYQSRGEIPPALLGRLLSVRAYDADGSLRSAEVVGSTDLEALIERLADREGIEYLQVHNAGPGCFICQVDLD